MTAFAIYRLPHEDHATLIRQSEGEPEEFLSCAELNGRRGFVVAPFQISEQQPLLLIRPDVIETVPIEGELSETEYSLTSHLSPLTSSYFTTHPICPDQRLTHRPTDGGRGSPFHTGQPGEAAHVRQR